MPSLLTYLTISRQRLAVPLSYMRWCGEVTMWRFIWAWYRSIARSEILVMGSRSLEVRRVWAHSNCSIACHCAKFRSYVHCLSRIFDRKFCLTWETSSLQTEVAKESNIYSYLPVCEVSSKSYLILLTYPAQCTQKKRCMEIQESQDLHELRQNIVK